MSSNSSSGCQLNPAKREEQAHTCNRQKRPLTNSTMSTVDDHSNQANPLRESLVIDCCEDCLQLPRNGTFPRKNFTIHLSETSTKSLFIFRTYLIMETVRRTIRWCSSKCGSVKIRCILNRRGCFSIPFALILLLSLVSPCYMHDSLKFRDDVQQDASHHTSGSTRNSRSFDESSNANHHQDDVRHSTKDNNNRLSQSQHSNKFHNSGAEDRSQHTQTSSCSSCKLREELKLRNLEYIKNQVLLKLGLTQAPNITSYPKITPARIQEVMKKFSASKSRMDFGMQGDDPNPGSFGDMWSEGKTLWKEGISVHEEESDDFHAKTKKVIAFAQPYPRLRHSGKEHDILQFRFSDKILRHRVKEAVLNVYIDPPPLSTNRKKRSSKNTSDKTQPNTNRQLRGEGNSDKRDNDFISIIPTSTHAPNDNLDGRTISISVYKVSKNSKSKNPDAPTFELITSEDILRSQLKSDGKWIQLDISPMISSWFKSPRENFGFVVRAEDENGDAFDVQHLKSDDDAKIPYCEVYTIDLSQKRKKRSLGLDCNETSKENRCCRYPLLVDFQEFGWDWIIAPKQYQANYCSGECGYAFLQKFPHTHVASLASPVQADSKKPPVEACCAPRKMSSMSMLYFDQELNIIFGTLPNMIVDRCGCS